MGVTKFGFWDPPPIAMNVWWIGGNTGGYFLTWSQEGTIRLSNLFAGVLLELLCWPLGDAFNFRQV